jgi:A/G-specific adenine glycosylase
MRREGAEPPFPPLPHPRIAAALLAWYEAGHRRLPWRETSDPYAVWVSEVMLQQTRVETVIPYYLAFLARFPDVASLAAAPEEEVLKAWEGLGYYRRARNLQAAARRIAAEGAWPRSGGELTRLPGIGRSTAGAIASIAFGLPSPILDGNVRRVWCRLAARRDPRPSDLWPLSAELVQHGDPAVINQALMELGATVCTPKDPACAQCPLRHFCAGLAAGAPASYPAPPSRKPVPVYDVSVAFLWRGERFLVTRRPDGALLGGLWELPGGKWEAGEGGEEAVRREMREELGINVRVLRAHPVVRHAYSHFAVRLHPYDCEPAQGGEPRSALPSRWILPAEISGLAFPRGTRKIFSAVLRVPDALRAAEAAAPYDSPSPKVRR